MFIDSGIGNAAAIVIGLIVGSFLNVVIARLPGGGSINHPPSHCPKCQTRIRWSDNIPVLSFLALRGKCRACRAPISIRYPMIEILTAFLFLAAKVRFGVSWELLLRDFPFLAILIAVAFIDLEHRIIPDPLSLGGMAWGLLTALIFIWQDPTGLGTSIGWGPSWIGAAVGFGCFYALAWIYLRLTDRSGLGGGDIKLLGMMGAFLGFHGVFVTILVSSIFGSIVGIGWALLQRRLSRSDGAENSQGNSLMMVSIPYGPFLVVGGLYYYFLSDVLWPQFTNLM